MITTTLNRIREHSPWQDGWGKLLNGLGKTKPDDKPLPFATILEIVGLDDAIWCCRAEPQYAKEWRLFTVAVVRRVQHLNTDPRVKNAIDVAERYAHGDATDAKLNAARVAAKDAAGAARDAARDARAAAWAVAWAAGAAGAAEGAAKAARAAAWVAAGAAGDAARAIAKAAGEAAKAAWEAAWAAEREWQTQEFLRLVNETEAGQI